MDDGLPGHGLDEDLAAGDGEGGGGTWLDGGLFQQPSPGSPPPFGILPFPPLCKASADLGDCGASAPGAAAVELTANLCMGLLGTGVLAAPKAFADAGCTGGLLAVAVAAIASWASWAIVGELGQGSPRSTVILEMAHRAFGPQGFAAGVVLHLVVSGGLMTAHLVAVADILGQGAVLTTGRAHAVPRWLLALLALALCAPGALARGLRLSGAAGVLCAVGAAGLALALVAACSLELLPPWAPLAPSDPQGAAEDAEPGVSSAQGFLAALRVFVVQFAVQASSLQVPRGGSGRSWPRAAARRAFLAVVPLVAAIGALGYLRFGGSTPSNALDALRPSVLQSGFVCTIGLATVQAVYGAGLIIGFGYLMVCCRNCCLELFLVRRSGGGVSGRGFRRATAGILAATGLLAWLASDVHLVLLWVGAWGAGPLCYALPALLAVELARQDQARPWLHIRNAVPALLLLVAALAVASGFGGLVSLALSPPAGHRGHRVATHSLLNITVGRPLMRIG